jgi:putative two-component system response regulator
MGHVVISAANGQEALEILLQVEGIDLVVTDIMMPKMDGYELLQAIRGNEVLRDICVIMITAKAGDDPKLRALGIGADDYLNKPINVRELDARIRNLLTAQELHRAAANAAVLDQRIDELRLSFAQTLSFRDAETATHSREVLEIGSQIAEELGIELDQTLKDSLLLHDIGKIGIPDRILLKKTYLENDERKLMERHAELGKELLEGFSNFRDVSEIIWAHQEHWDGTGISQETGG